MADVRKYLDFVIHLQNLDEAKNVFQVSVPHIPGIGGTSNPVEVPYLDSKGDLKYFMEGLERGRGRARDGVDLGKLLAERLLPEREVRGLFKQARQKAGQDGGVRLRLVVAERDLKLARIPWEFTYDPDRLKESKPDFCLVINPRISMVRHIPLPEAEGSTEAHQPDRLVVVPLLANARVPGQQPLDLALEKRVLESAFAGFMVDGVELEWEPLIEGATPEDLTRVPLRKPDVFHFAGHGQLDPADTESGELTYEGKLAFQKSSESDDPSLVTALDLGRRLAGGVRLAVLGACHTGRTDGVSPWSGVAPVLVQQGIPAVVAMQYAVADTAAILFNQAFYTALGAGLSIDEAVSEGRRMMLGDQNISSDDNVQWGLPVLYMRDGEGVLLPRLAARENKTAETLRFLAVQEGDEIAKGGSVVGQRIKLTEKSAGKNVYAEVRQTYKVVRDDLLGQEIEI